jgi:hypothetical protein
VSVWEGMRLIKRLSLVNRFSFPSPFLAQRVRDTFKDIGVVFLMDVIILILWTVLDPLQWQRVVIREDVFGDTLESQGYCT